MKNMVYVKATFKISSLQQSRLPVNNKIDIFLTTFFSAVVLIGIILGRTLGIMRHFREYFSKCLKSWATILLSGGVKNALLGLCAIWGYKSMPHDKIETQCEP